MDNSTSYWNTVLKSAKEASHQLLSISSAQKNEALTYLHHEILTQLSDILKANETDLIKAKEEGFDDAFLDRLQLTETRIRTMAAGVLDIAMLSDPIGEISHIKPMPSGICVGQMRVPLGVIGIIYESRPNVTIDAAALCFKAGNAAILRGGSEAFHTNQCLASILKMALAKAHLPEQTVQVIESQDRIFVDYMITANQYIDVIIPRGGKSLIQRIQSKATVPVIKHLDGICHTFVDRDADITKAIAICDNAKTQRYAPCNTMETLLVHHRVAGEFLPKIATIFQQKYVEMRGCPHTLSLLQGLGFSIAPATEEDWSTEYLAPIISIKIIHAFDEAITHINHYGSHHTDVIISENYTRAQQFLRHVDSACVMVNASSRFCDGFEFGLGAEIGISTDKLHARGPVGLEGLTSLKYIVLGNGEIRS